jgi:shikimate kinase
VKQIISDIDEVRSRQLMVVGVPGRVTRHQATSGEEYHTGHMSGPDEIRLVGPGGAGKSTIGAPLAARLEVAFVDLDRHLAGRIGDISEYIGRHGYDAYARENVETYCSLFRGEFGRGVAALSSGFMTYACDIHPEYSRVRRELEQHPNTFVLLPSFDRDVCVAETVRRQIARPFGRPSAKEEAVIRVRFEIYMSLPVRKIETMRPVAAVVAEIVAALSLETK